MCDQIESVVLHWRENKLVAMLAADGRDDSRCVCVCGGGGACTVACTSIIFDVFFKYC